MDCSIIAISRTLGAGGEDLGAALAEALGYRYVDAEIIERASHKAGVSRETVAKVENRKGLIGRILDNLGESNPGAMYGAPEFGAYAADAAATQTFEELIVEVIQATAAEGNVVIVAHGASIPLAGTPGLLRVLVTAPIETRTTRVALGDGIIGAEAAKKVANSDKARADYFRRFYQLEREQPVNYDLTINTDVLSIAQAKAAILALVKG